MPCVRCRAGGSRLRDLLRDCPGRRVRGRLGGSRLRLGLGRRPDRRGEVGQCLRLASQGRSRLLSPVGCLVGALRGHGGALRETGQLILAGAPRSRRRGGSGVDRPVLILHRGQLGRRLGDLAIEAGDLRRQFGRRGDGAARVGQGQRPARLLQARLDGGSFGHQGRSFPLEGRRLGRATFVGHAVLRQALAGVVQGLAQVAGARGVVGESGQQVARLTIGRGQGVGGGLRLGAGELEIRLRPGQGRGCRRPAVGRDPYDRAREGRPGVLARDLLLGLLGQPAHLRAELAGDVTDAGKVGFRLDQASLRLTSSSLVAAYPGGLLEERPPLLRPQREGLVDHALADEQEGVVGEVRAVQQVEQIPQADPLAVQEVLVLARAVEPPRQGDLAVGHRQQAVPVLEGQGDLGHADGPAGRRPGEDDVLRLVRAQGAALLAEGPSQRVGEIALAAPVGTDDGRDAGPELQRGPLGERLETDDPQAPQAGFATHGVACGDPAMAPSRSSASCAARVSAARRLLPSPRPSTWPSTSTSMTKWRA